MNDSSSKDLAYQLSESIALFRSTKINTFDLKGIKTAEFSILILIVNSNTSICANDISKYLNCSKVYVGRIVNQLLEKHLIRKEKSATDARLAYLWATSAGEELVHTYMDNYMKTTNYLYLQLGSQKAQELTLLLKDATKIINNFSKENNK